MASNMEGLSAHSPSTTCYKACIVITHLIQLWSCKNNHINLYFTSTIFILSPAMTFLPCSNFRAVNDGILYAAAEVLCALSHFKDRSVAMFFGIRAVLYMMLYWSSAVSVILHGWSSSDVMIHLVPLLWPKDKRKLQLQLSGFVFCTLIESGLKIAVPLQFTRIIDTSGGLDLKRHILLYIAAIYLSSEPIPILKRMSLRPLLEDVNANMKTTYFDHVMALSRDFHDKENAAKVGSLVFDSPPVTELVRLVLVDLIPLIMDLLMQLFILYHHCGSHAVMANAVTIVLDLWFSGILMRQQDTYFREFNRADRHQHSVLCKAIENRNAAINFGQIDRERSRYVQAIQKMAESGRQYSYWNYIRSVVSLTILYTGCALTILLMPEGLDSTGNSILLVTQWNKLATPLRELGRFSGRITEQISKCEGIIAVLKRPSLVQDLPDARPMSSDSFAEVEFVDLSFTYPDRTEPALQQISISFPRGQTTAIVGPSGAGKSTTLEMIQRNYDPSKGLVKIGGQDIRRITLDSLRMNIGIVPQDIKFLDESILSILQYAQPNASLDDIEEACKKVGLMECIGKFPAGFETTVGDGGSQISGGQRQRLSIVQNVLKNSKVLLLDEHTSAIDAGNKRLVHRYLKESTQTIIMVTHDLEVVRDVDKIIVMKDRRVEDQGSHEELMGRPGYYRDVFCRQHAGN